MFVFVLQQVIVIKLIILNLFAKFKIEKHDHRNTVHKSTQYIKYLLKSRHVKVDNVNFKTLFKAIHP